MVGSLPEGDRSSRVPSSRAAPHKTGLTHPRTKTNRTTDRIRPLAESAGMCRIIPPEGWAPPFTIDPAAFKFPTRCVLRGGVVGFLIVCELVDWSIDR